MKNKIWYLITSIVSLGFSFFITLRIQTNSWNLSNLKELNIFFYLIISILLEITLLLWIKKEKFLKILIEKRYWISFILFLFCVLGKLHGSSINMWDTIIEPSNSFQKDSYLGVGRAIRSDEWLVNTPYQISQKYNDYKVYSNLPRAKKTDMFTPIFVPIKDILVLTRPFNIGYLLFNEEYGLSIYWYGRLFSLILITFEFFLLLTNKKEKLSLLATFLLVGSPLIQWFYSNYIVDLLISGELTIILLSKFLKEDKKSKKLLFSIGIGLSISWYLFTLYPAWQISLGYIFLLIGIEEIRKNKLEKKDFLYLLIPLLIGFIFLFRFLRISKDTLNIILNTVYPGKRNIIGGGTIIEHFLYPISILFPFKNYINPSEASGVFSFFPISFIYSFYYLIKNKKKDNFLIKSLLSLGIIYSIFCIFKLPNILTKITLLYLVPTERIYPMIGIISLLLLILTLGKIEIKKNNQIPIILISFLLGIIIPIIGNEKNPKYLNNYLLIGIMILMIGLIYLYLNSSKKKLKYILAILLIGISTSNIIFVNPVNKGIKVLTEKKLSKKINQIIKKDSSNWIALNSIELPNYVLANGGKVINSTNIYPNLELWNKLDKEKKYEDIYNRYAHIEIILTEDKTSFELIQGDYFKCLLNPKDFDKIDFKYIIIQKEIDSNFKEYVHEIYQNDNIWIYEVREKSV